MLTNPSDVTTTRSIMPDNARNILEAAIFASELPLKKDAMRRLLPPDTVVDNVLKNLQDHYSNRGITLLENESGWFFATARNVSDTIRSVAKERKSLSRAAMETLAVIAWHQPVTRSEIEKVRGVSISGGILDTLMEGELVRPLGRRVALNNPLEWGTTARFLQAFDLRSIEDLPGLEELRQSGFMPNETLNAHIGGPLPEESANLELPNPAIPGSSRPQANLFDVKRPAIQHPVTNEHDTPS